MAAVVERGAALDALHPGVRLVGLRLGPPRALRVGARLGVGDLGLALTAEQATAALRLLWSRTKQVVEPSSAIALAAVLAHRELFAGRRVGIVLSGGNVDLDALAPLLARAAG